MLSTSTSHPPVAFFVDPKYLNELVRGIRFPAKHVGLKHYVLFLLISSCRSTSNINYCHISLLLSLSVSVFPSASLTKMISLMSFVLLFLVFANF